MTSIHELMSRARGLDVARREAYAVCGHMDERWQRLSDELSIRLAHLRKTTADVLAAPVTTSFARQLRPRGERCGSRNRGSGIAAISLCGGRMHGKCSQCASCVVRSFALRRETIRTHAIASYDQPSFFTNSEVGDHS